MIEDYESKYPDLSAYLQGKRETRGMVDGAELPDRVLVAAQQFHNFVMRNNLLVPDRGDRARNAQASTVIVPIRGEDMSIQPKADSGGQQTEIVAPEDWQEELERVANRHTYGTRPRMEFPHKVYYEEDARQIFPVIDGFAARIEREVESGIYMRKSIVIVKLPVDLLEDLGCRAEIQDLSNRIVERAKGVVEEVLLRTDLL
jgi:hypothetical protein